MKWERRKLNNLPQIQTDLPVDYVRLVIETLNAAEEKGLAIVRKTHPKAAFTANGAIYSDEILLAITLSQGEQDLAANTVYASAEFNPNLEISQLESVLGACLDATGAVFDFYLNPAHPDRIEDFLHYSLSALDEAPFEWTPVEIHEIVKHPVWVRMDKLNPLLESIADQWLEKNDPTFSAKTEEAPAEAEEFLEERLEAIKSAKSGASGSGPITH